ncbi:chaperone modulator CbpM [Lewinella sp. W8]|uniref:chaperone modulator CbpM n=1 Tax=Lewinella sp. W8 TaxID=2528208 RepID=UPI001067D5A9|nr:chaperone modulator CbpM [Lewinella sp. W8]MTB50173.1 hypothetical protein [Lewinella sp. W8]
MAAVQYVTIQQFCDFHGCETLIVEEFLEYGIFEANRQPEGMVLIPSPALPRLERALRLHRELGVNAAGIDIIFNLLDRLENRLPIEDAD